MNLKFYIEGGRKVGVGIGVGGGGGGGGTMWHVFMALVSLARHLNIYFDFSM